jgi:RNA polymerase sigma-70 factor, ECF subfamily
MAAPTNTTSVAHNQSDEEIVALVRTGDTDRYAEIIRRYQKKLLRYVTYLIGDEQLAADAAQEAFIKAYVNLHSFNLHQNFSSWLYRIAHNQAINLVTKFKPHPMVTEAFTADSGVDLEDAYIKKELQQQLRQCIETIPLMYKEPLVLFFLEEKSYEEISDILRLPTNTVGTRINRAKQLVKKLCQKNQPNT